LLPYSKGCACLLEPVMEMEALNADFLEPAFESSSSLFSGRERPAASNAAKADGMVSPHYHLFDCVHIALIKDGPLKPALRPRTSYFSIDGVVCYFGFADDFGPMNLGSIYRFCEILEEEMERSPDQDIALLTSCDCKDLTNAVFLMGSYMIMKMGWDLRRVTDSFKALLPMVVSYRDVTPGEQNFHLFVQDCWGGLIRARNLSWVDFGEDGFDPDEYSQLDSPLNADLHEVVI
jgi:hypothetical protein